MTDGWMAPGAGPPPERPGDGPVVVSPPVGAPVAYPPVAYPPAAYPVPTQYAPPVDPNQNWGLAYPGYTGGYIVLVPRPPRPGAVTLAIYLTYVGVIISGVLYAINSIYTWTHRDELLAAATAGTPTDAEASSFVDMSLTVGLVIGLLSWLLPAAGAVVCVELSRRGRNAARIVLACLAGVFALNNLCGAGFGLVARSSGISSGSPAVFNAGAGVTWWAVPVQAVLAAMAIVILVLLLIPSANRYFSAGPGRRFAPSP